MNSFKWNFRNVFNKEIFKKAIVLVLGNGMILFLTMCFDHHYLENCNHYANRTYVIKQLQFLTLIYLIYNMFAIYSASS